MNRCRETERALLCHCEGYPGSRTSDFDTYCRWVRAAELDAGIFYTDSPATLADQRYLASVEPLQREDAAADRAIAAHAEADELNDWNRGPATALGAPGLYLPLQLRTLKGLYRLTGFWSGADGDILLRFAQLVLRGFGDMMKVPALANDPAVQALLNTLFADEWAWLQRTIPDPAHDERLPWEPAALQGAILDDGPRATHGALVLLRVTDPQRDCRVLRGTCESDFGTAPLQPFRQMHMPHCNSTKAFGLRACHVGPGSSGCDDGMHE